MKINIASTHRFHLLDLARELEKQGHNVRFYSYVPTRRCVSFGLSKKACKSFLWLAAPFLLLNKIFPKSLRIIRYRNIIIDTYIASFSRECDIFICIGSVYNCSIISVKKKYDAVTIVEWGSKHILEQLKALNKTSNYPKKSLKRELMQYELADYISIPCDHVKKTFLIQNIPISKLITNPYGVELNHFRPTVLTGDYDIIMVGGWRVEKGCDLLIEVCRKFNYRLLHVGALMTLNFPDDTRFTHVDSVNQNQLINYYSQAKVFVLPSRAEGLAMVQVQAIACGLPVVCSTETGGHDLKNLLDDKEWIIEMANFSIDELGKCIIRALQLAATQIGYRNYTTNVIKKFSWDAYGKRYDSNLNRLIN